VVAAREASHIEFKAAKRFADTGTIFPSTKIVS